MNERSAASAANCFARFFVRPTPLYVCKQFSIQQGKVINVRVKKYASYRRLEISHAGLS